MSQINNLDVKWVPVSDLVPNPRNPNKHSDSQVERLAKLIRYQGFRLPIIVSNLSGFIVAGHGRLEAAKRLGLTTVPVTTQDFEDETQEYAFLVSDNAIHEWSELNMKEIEDTVKGFGEFDHELLGLISQPVDFDEPDEKSEPSEKQVDLKTCPNCGVVIDG